MKKILKRIIDIFNPKRPDIPADDFIIADEPITVPTRPPVHIKPEIVNPPIEPPIEPPKVEK